MSQDDLAAESGLTRSQIAGIETGRQTAYAWQAVEIAKALGVSTSHLLEQSECEFCYGDGKCHACHGTGTRREE